MRRKTQGPQWADSRLVRDKKNIGNTQRKEKPVKGPAMVVCCLTVETWEWGAKDTARGEEGMEFMMAQNKNKRKQFRTERKWALTSWWGLNVTYY